jgi:hypothetical protein
MNPEQKSMSRIVGRMFLTLYILKYHSNEVFTTIDILDKTMLHYQACNIINYLGKEYLFFMFIVNIKCSFLLK